MALFHFHVTQIKRSAGQSAVASAAYRAGEKLHSEYYGEDSDYTRKGGVICSEILLPSHAPPEYADRETLWNAVEKAERGKKAQLAYSFDIALQNEFSMQENVALARQFLLQNFVSRGMVVDFAVHSPGKEDNGISNPHFHVMCPIRPIEPNGKWGNKQRREYVLDEYGERIRDEAGNYVFNAVPTTDWGSPDTLEHWRQAWADLCNTKFAEKGLDCRIDHRSYEQQGVDQLPTIHEGVTVRAMEAKGIRTDKGDLNRWIKTTNNLIRNLKKKISALLDWLKEAHEELSKPQAPDLAQLLSEYYTNRNAGAWSQNAKIGNLKEFNEIVNYLMENKLTTPEELQERVSALSGRIDILKCDLRGKTERMKELDELLRMVQFYTEGKPLADKLATIKWKGKRQQFASENENALRLYHMAERKLKLYFKDGKLPITAWRKERDRLEQEYKTEQAELSPIYAEVKKLWQIKYKVEQVIHEQERQNTATRQKKQEMER
ncbi:MAG: mobilization protein [Lachnospiraceae bacterium]|nr:mobilization protein [Lachnospiraceae bacterium]